MIFISLSVGTTTPNEMVEIIMTINNTSSTKPNHLNANAKMIESTIINEKTVSANCK